MLSDQMVRTLRYLSFLGVFCGFATLSHADRYGTTADPEFGHTIDLSYSYGVILDRDADFWGPSFSFAKAVDDRWGYSISIAADQETGTRDDGTRNTATSFTGIGTLYYGLTDRVSAGA